MAIKINSSGWQVRRTTRARGAAPPALEDLPGLRPEFLTGESSIADEATLQPAATKRSRGPEASSGLDLTYDLESGHVAVLAVRHPSGALTFSLPIDSVSRGLGGPAQVRFQVPVRTAATRGLAGQAVKAIVIKIAKVAGDKAVSFVLPKLAEAVEKDVWRRRGLSEGWMKVSQSTLAAGKLEAGSPVSPLRSLLLLHGSFSDGASAYRALADSTFFERLKATYDDRIFAFNGFSVCRTPEQNARMLLDSLPDHATTFDVVTHGRGGLVLRTIVERGQLFGNLARRFKLGHAVLVASPNDGTPLASPQRWDDTLGWLANVLEMFPDNPFTTGPALVANGLVWLANHALGDLPGLHAMDGAGAVIEELQGTPGPPPGAYSALVANYQPSGNVLKRLLDIGVDQLFGGANDLVMPAEGGWRIHRSRSTHIPAARIGCFGPGGNLGGDAITHLNFFSRPETVDFMVNALLGQPQPVTGVDPRKSLPDRRLLRGSTDAVPAGTKGGPARAPDGRGSIAPAPEEETLRITVVNGDLTFEAEALLLGHYQASRLTGTEKVMDGLIGGMMARSLAMSVYPVAIGSHQIFINNRPNLERGTFMPRPKAVIIAGLGEEGKLRAADLVQTVRQAVIAWAQRFAEGKGPVPRTFELAATLLGSGGTGVSAGEAARLIAEGVYQANMLLADEAAESNTVGPVAPRVSHLRFVELYLDRATEAWRALRLQEASRPGRYLITPTVKPGTGALQRTTDLGYRGAEFDFISVAATTDADGVPVISYTLDTKRARSEVRGQRAQSMLINELVATASNDHNNDQQIGRTLFGLLVPIELEAYLAGSGEMQIDLDPQTAGIPWELLDTKREANDDPWALRVNLLRKLRISKFRDRVNDAGAGDSALVIGEPECPPEYPRLYGARAEALAVRTCLTGTGGLAEDAVTGLINPDATQSGPGARAVVNALFERPWRIVHIAGHGVPGKRGKPGGVVLSNGTFLGPAEIGSMRTVPELVFINCCHLGAADARQLLNTYHRAEFASGVAGELISLGVRCVIAAGWAVDDDGARVFAEEFYGSLLRGNRFITAVGNARMAAYRHNPDQNTWAAYQCYGDPHWVFRQAPSDPNRASSRATEDFSGVASATSLRLALDRIIVEIKFQGADRAAKLESLRQLEKNFRDGWGRMGDVAAMFGEAFAEAGDVESGVKWYQVAVTASDGRAPMRAAEQLGNLRSRLAWEIVDQAVRHLDDMKTGEKPGGKAAKARTDAKRARVAAESALAAAIRRADTLVADGLALLEMMIALEATMERASLIGSAYKRRALVNGAAGRRGPVDRDLNLMAASYAKAQAIGEKSANADVFYPAVNRLVAEVALNAGKPRWRNLDRATVEIVEKSLKASEPDFWSVIGAIELDQYRALAKRRFAAAVPRLEKAYADAHRRVESARMWSSVYDTACLVLPSYANRATAKEKAAALTLLAQLRQFAHPAPK